MIANILAKRLWLKIIWIKLLMKLFGVSALCAPKAAFILNSDYAIRRFSQGEVC